MPTFTSKSEYNPKEHDWLNPIAMLELQRAVKQHMRAVVLNGVKFSITYGQFFESKYDGKHDGVKLRRVDGGYAPFGYVRLKKILDYDLESDV